MNYEKIYNDIISKAKAEDRKKIKGEVYYELHHIIPKCMGGTNDKSNVILLTAKEHYICHRLLCEIYPVNRNLRYAIWMMINGSSRNNNRYSPSSRIYTQLREYNATIPRSEETRKKISNSSKGNPKSELHKIQISNSSKGKIHSEETKKKMSGKIRSNETKKKMSESAKGRIMSEESKIKIGNASKGRNIGRIITEESRKKMSESAKNRKNKEKLP
jgi:hypothetical protein